MANPRGRPPKNRVTTIDPSLLSEDEREELRAEARAKVGAERKLAAEDAYREQALQEARREVGEEEELREIIIDLPEFADRLRIDSVVYFHGRSYTVSRSQFCSMTEMISRMWGHQEEINGRRPDPRRPLNRQVSPHGVINMAGLMRV